MRGSWGLVGNNRIGNYDAIARTGTGYYVLNGALVNAVNPINYPNPDLGWEKPGNGTWAWNWACSTSASAWRPTSITAAR